MATATPTVTHVAMSMNRIATMSLPTAVSRFQASTVNVNGIKRPPTASPVNCITSAARASTQASTSKWQAQQVCGTPDERNKVGMVSTKGNVIRNQDSEKPKPKCHAKKGKKARQERQERMGEVPSSSTKVNRSASCELRCVV